MHHEIEAILGLLLVVAALAVVAQRLAVPYPILLVIGGLVLGFIPGLPHIELEPELVFVLFLPPLLNSAAWYTSWRDFRFNLRPILLLAIGLVLATTFAVATVAHFTIAGVTWATGFVLGAIVSPPDAVAATAITQRLNVPRRVVTVLEGESLINDATGLVAYRFAVAAVATGAFSLWEAGLRFFLMAIGGVLIGLAMGWIIVKIHSLMDDSLVEITSSILMCFVTYMLAERLGVSGVLAVVALGLYHRRKSPEVLSPRTRIQMIAVWDIIVFLLNGLIFILIGLQLPTILNEISEYSLTTLIWYGVLVSVVAIAVRLLWVYPSAYIPRLLSPKLRERDPYPDWRLLLLIGWAGMRGVVSLAAALALPLTISNGAPFPNRGLILFLTFCVILVTLVLQGLTLPLLIRWFQIVDDDNIEREEMEGRLRAAEAALDRLDELVTKGGAETEAELIQWLRTQYDERIRSISACCVAIDTGSRDRLTVFRRLQQEMLSAERRTAIQLRNQGIINDEVLHRIERDLDLEETRLGK